MSFGRPWGGGDVFASPHSWVDVDGAAGTRAATAWALQHHGPRVGWFGWPADGGTGDDRESGWRTAMAEATASGPSFAVPNDVAGARREMTALFAQPATLDALDALVCVSDSLAVGAHLAASEAGRPDLPIIGFDNTPVAEALGLSSIEQAPELVAGGTLDLLMGPTGNVVTPGDPGVAPSHVLVEPRLIVRTPTAHR